MGSFCNQWLLLHFYSRDIVRVWHDVSRRQLARLATKETERRNRARLDAEVQATEGLE